MIRFKPSRTTVAAVVAVVLILAAGGAAVASNMGFKMNKAFYPPNAAKPGAGDNWTSIPFNRPYSTFADVCTQLALPNVSTSIFQVNPETGATRLCSCGTAACGTLKLDLTDRPVAELPGGVAAPYLGIRIRNNTFVAGTSSAIIVGSHSPSLQLLLRRIPSATCGDVTAGASSNIGATWFSVPYHTTAVTAQDLCVQSGVPAGPSATVARVDPINGTAASPAVTCNTSAASTLNLVLGEAVRIRRTSAGVCTPLSSIPAHF
ncbi:MAG TPA: hypothetical protein VEW47_11460 [Candidatus Dormibacteraeota bacterium]|nr:hypothetical protein [Candidatus Dormibacteraeota bacterium]